MIREKSFYRMVFGLVLPMAGQNLINVGVGMCDTLMLGRVSEKALAGASLGNQPFFLLTLVLFGISSGASVLTAQYWGKGDTQTIRRILGMAIRYALMVAVVFSLCTVLLPDKVLSIFTSDQEIIVQGIPYLRIVGGSYIFSAVTVTYLNIIRSVEKVMVPMCIYSISFTINVIINSILIFGPAQMGTSGAAIGTTVSRFVEVILTLTFALRINKTVRFKITDLFQKSKDLFQDFVRYSGPVLLNECLYGLGISMHSVILGHLNGEAVAAYAIAYVVMQLSTVVMFGVSNASAVIIGKYIGAGEKEQASNAAGTLLILSLAVGAFGAILILVCMPLIFALYSLSALASEYLRMMLIVLAITTFFKSITCTIIVGIMRGGGDTRFSLFLDAGNLWFSVLLGFLGGYVFQWGVTAVMILLNVEEIPKTILGIWRIRSKKWIKDVTRNQIEQPVNSLEEA
ncbi:MATE family efflux transporter [Solibaculum mannosilyticum]|uniref:MATE family efflux transporter n=1 Tax=Solibaculum mannosilyticum TaxID=2780922 RepID=UPI0034A83FF2